MDLVLRRFAATADGTIGRMGDWYVLEEEDQGNLRNVSSIPAGTYICRRTTYYSGGYPTFEVTDVPGRSRILIHIGNTEEDTAGCLLLGMKVGTLSVSRPEDGSTPRYKIAVLSSGTAFRQFLAAEEGRNEFKLTIIDPEPSV